MADQNITALPVATTPESSDRILLVGATEEKLINYDELADAILRKIASKNFTLDQGNKTLLAALNELNSKTPIGGIYDLNNPPERMIFSATVGSTNLPENLGDANAVTVIRMKLGPGNFDSMIVFSFATDRIAIRRKNGTENWSEWKYFTAQ